MSEPNRKPTTLPPDLILTLHHVDHWRHIVKLISFAVIYFASAGIAMHWSQNINHPLQWLLLIPLYLLAAASLHGISLFTHEAVHGTLCSNRLRNDLGGAICAFPVLQTCRAYRVLHLKHHAHLGDAGDLDHHGGLHAVEPDGVL